MVAEKIFRLSKTTAAEANLNSFLGTELQAFMESISAVPKGIINILKICGSIFGLTFVIGRSAYATLALILGKSS